MRIAAPSARPNVTVKAINASWNTAAQVDQFSYVRWYSAGQLLFQSEMTPFSDTSGSFTRNAPAGARDFQVDLYCSTTNGAVNCRFSDANHVVNFFGLVLILQESEPPDGGATGGTLLEPGVRGGTQSLNYLATDGDSGVRSVVARLGSTVIASDDFVGVCLYDDWNACPNSQARTLDVDTTRVSDGDYPLTLEITDAAGNPRTVDTGRTISIANGPGAPNGSPACTPCALTAAAGRKAQRHVRLRRKGGAAVYGRLVSATGAPVAGATLDVRNDAGIEGSVRTADDGGFIYAVPRGPTRHLVFAYRAHARDAEYTVETDPVLVRVDDAIRLFVRPRHPKRGHSTRLSGRVSGAPFASPGVLVVLQGRVGGKGHWRTFNTARAKPDGSFTSRYRFERAVRGQRFQLRVRASKQANFPYPTDYSRALSVRVR
jgi:hypothetical protein